MNPTLGTQLADLASRGRTSGVLDPEVAGRTVVLTFDHGGRTWGVHADSHVERLVELAAAMEAGRAVEGVTDAGTATLTDGRIEHLYVYEVSVPVVRQERVETACPRCFLVHAGECDR